MSSFQDLQTESANVTTNTNTNKKNFLYNHVNILGLKVPNVVLIILVIVLIWYLFTKNNTTHKLTPRLVGGALETSSSPTSSFFDNIKL